MLPSLEEIRFMSGNAALAAILDAARSGSPIGQTLYNAQYAASRATDLAAGARQIAEIKHALGLMTATNGLGQYGMPSMPPRNHTVFFTDENGNEQMLTVILSERNPMPAVLWTDAQQSEWLAAHPTTAYSYDPEVAAIYNASNAAAKLTADPQYLGSPATSANAPLPSAADGTIGTPVNPSHTEPDTTIFGMSGIAIAAAAGIALWIYSNSGSSE